jgi:hypothetical protein
MQGAALRRIFSHCSPVVEKSEGGDDKPQVFPLSGVSFYDKEDRHRSGRAQ